MLNNINLNSEIKENYEQKEVLISTGYSVSDQNITLNPPELVSIATAISNGQLDNTFIEKLIESVSTKLVEHITNNAETIGSYNSIVKINNNLQTLIIQLQVLITVFETWVPVPLDGGAALSVAIKLASQNIKSTLESIKTDLASMQIEKNII